MLSTGTSVSAAALAAGVHRNTIGHWRRTVPAFERELAAAQYDRILLWRDLSEEHTALAISTVRDLMADPKSPASVRLRAALALLKQSNTLPPVEPSVSSNTFYRNIAALLDPAQVFPSDPAPVVQNEKTEILHNPAQSPIAHPEREATKPQTFRHATPPLGRNEPCHCGSGRKYKICCLGRSVPR